MTLLNAVTPILNVEDLSVRRGGLPVVRGISLRVFAGTIASIVGPSGAGKTSALLAIARLISARGAVTFGGRRMDRLRSTRVVRWGLVHVPQRRGAMPALSVRENLELGAWTRRDRYAVRNDIGRMLERFPDLGRRAGSRAFDLDAAEQTQLALARGLMAKPRMLLLDEPSTGLPPERIAELFAIIAQINGEGMPILLAEQYERKALAVSDYVYVMDGGRIVKEGVARTMALEPEIVQAHLGSAAP